MVYSSAMFLLHISFLFHCSQGKTSFDLGRLRAGGRKARTGTPGGSCAAHHGFETSGLLRGLQCAARGHGLLKGGSVQEPQKLPECLL